MADFDLDRAPVAPAGLLGGVPVIDMCASPADVSDKIGRACREWGFFQVVSHGIPRELTAGVLGTAKRFFAQPAEVKRRVIRTADNPWGYYDRELTKEQRDRKEIFDIGPESGTAAEPFRGATPWPETPSEFAPVMNRWVEQMDLLAQRLVWSIADSLVGRADALKEAFEPTHTSFLRLNHYPVDDRLADEMGGEATFGIHHHSDAGALTVLLQDGVSGLQVYRDGVWHDVPAVPDAFTINIGDMVQVWSNDLYKAPVHRVLAMQDRDRISIPYFYNPSYSTVVEPLVGEPHYRPISWSEFRRRRAEGDYADYGTEVQISEWRIADA